MASSFLITVGVTNLTYLCFQA